MAAAPTNLRSQYAAARAKDSETLSYHDTTPEEYQSTLRATISAYEECQSQVSQLALFSSNEDFEEIPTSDIQYLSLEFHLAELLVKHYASDRTGTLRRAFGLYETFIERLSDYGLLSKEDSKLLEHLQSAQLNFSLVTSPDFAERRRIKVARFQEEKALKQKLEHLRQKENEITVDDEVVRELRIAELHLQVNQTFNSLDLLIQEYKMVSQMPQPSQNGHAYSGDSRQRSEEQRDGYSDRLDTNMIGGLGRGKGVALLSKEGKPLQPFTLTSQRDELRKGVFRPSHNLPTMSIDEYLAEEKRRGGIIEGGGEASLQQPEPDEDNMELADQETMKARAWDKYTEANPKGSGNTLNRG